MEILDLQKEAERNPPRRFAPGTLVVLLKSIGRGHPGSYAAGPPHMCRLLVKRELARPIKSLPLSGAAAAELAAQLAEEEADAAEKRAAKAKAEAKAARERAKRRGEAAAAAAEAKVKGKAEKKK